jgi:hypothetical protein
MKKYFILGAIAACGFVWYYWIESNMLFIYWSYNLRGWLADVIRP